VEDEEDEEEGGGEEAAREQNISTKICENSLQLSQTLRAFLNYYLQLRTAFKNTSQKCGNKFLCWICGRNVNELYIGNIKCAV
jgi:hypothetical protein